MIKDGIEEKQTNKKIIENKQQLKERRSNLIKILIKSNNQRQNQK